MEVILQLTDELAVEIFLLHMERVVYGGADVSWGLFVLGLSPMGSDLGRGEVKCCCSVAKSCLTLCNPIDCTMPGSSILHYRLEVPQIHVS